MTANTPSSAAAHGVRGSAWRKAKVLIVLVAILTLLGGCGLRLETPPPSAPAPDAAEVLREAMVADALTIKQYASDLRGAADVREDTQAVLDLVVQSATEHELALGGIYDPGPEYVSTEPPVTSPSDEPVTVETLVTKLAVAANRARSTLPTESEPLRARLYATIAASNHAHAVELSATQDGEALPTTDFGDAVAAAGTAPLPEGIPVEETSELIASLDAVGYAREQWGLRQEGNRATRILNKSKAERAQAMAWADSYGLTGTPEDPRELFYVIGDDPTSPRAIRSFIRGEYVEQTHRYSALLATVEPDARIAVLDLMTATYLEARNQGADAQVFPGMREY